MGGQTCAVWTGGGACFCQLQGFPCRMNKGMTTINIPDKMWMWRGTTPRRQTPQRGCNPSLTFYYLTLESLTISQVPGLLSSYLCEHFGDLSTDLPSGSEGQGTRRRISQERSQSSIPDSLRWIRFLTSCNHPRLAADGPAQTVGGPF